MFGSVWTYDLLFHDIPHVVMGREISIVIHRASATTHRGTTRTTPGSSDRDTQYCVERQTQTPDCFDSYPALSYQPYGKNRGREEPSF